MVEKLNGRATVNEVASIADNSSQAITNAAIDDGYLATMNTKLESNASLMLEGIGTPQGKIMTAETEAADGERDDLQISLNAFLKAYLYWNDEATVASAELLYKIVKAHKMGMVRTSFEKQSAVLDSMLTKFDGAEAVAAVEKLGLTALVAKLKAAQHKFKLTYIESAKAEAEKADVVTPSSIKKETIGFLNSITSYLNAVSIANPAVYGELTATIAEMVNDLNAKIKARKKSI